MQNSPASTTPPSSMVSPLSRRSQTHLKLRRPEASMRTQYPFSPILTRFCLHQTTKTTEMQIFLSSLPQALSPSSPNPPGAPACVPWVHLPGGPSPPKCCRGPRACGPWNKSTLQACTPLLPASRPRADMEALGAHCPVSVGSRSPALPIIRGTGSSSRWHQLHTGLVLHCTPPLPQWGRSVCWGEGWRRWRWSCAWNTKASLP